MDNTFDIGRFGKYFIYDLKSRWSDQRTFMLLLALLPVIFYIIYIFFAAVFHGELLYMFTGGEGSRPGLWPRIAVFAVAVFMFLMLFPSLSYGFITDKAKGSAWLVLPASRVEKFASMMLLSLVVIPAAFFAVYLASDALVCLLDGNCGIPIVEAWGRKLWGEESIKINGDGAIVSYNSFWLLVAQVPMSVSVFLLGALIFKKRKVANTLLALFVLTMVVSALMGITISIVGEDRFGNAVNDWISLHGDKLDFWINLSTNVQLFVTVVGCGIWSWFRIKNIQH